MVLLHADGDVALVTLNDPERSNTWSRELCEDVVAASAAIGMARTFRSIVLQGAGPHFNVGANPYDKNSSWPLVATACFVHKMLLGFVRLRGLSLPMACAVHGKLIGGALAASLNGDYIVAERSATFEHGNMVRGVCPLGLLTQTLVGAVGRGLSQKKPLAGSRESERLDS